MNKRLLNLIKWLPKNSCVPYLKLKSQNKIRGIYSDKNIKKNTIIIQIPYDYLISKHKINEVGNFINNYSNNSIITLYILYQSLLKKSFGKPYLDSIGKKKLKPSTIL